MDDGTTAPRDTVRPRSAADGSSSTRGRAIAPHHRRRRALALALVVACTIVLIIGVSAGSGPSVASHHVSHGPMGFLARIQALADPGAGSFTAVEQSAESAAIDRTLAYTPYVRLAGAQHREIALTFDDGPGPYTPQVLSILEHEAVPATFFEVGVLERYFHASTAKIVTDGYPIGDHTESHAPMSKLSAPDQEAQLLEQTSQIGDYGAPFPRLFRPPYGLWNSTTLSLLHTYRMLMVLWTVDTDDYKRPGVSAIVGSVMSGARPGAIILLHDAGGDRTETVRALRRIIAGLRSRGYSLVTVPRLLLDNPAPANQSIPAGLAGGGG